MIFFRSFEKKLWKNFKNCFPQNKENLKFEKILSNFEKNVNKFQYFIFFFYRLI